MITGGVDETGLLYRWSVTHDEPSGLARLEFPHFRGAWVRVPEGWDGELTHPRGEGGRDGVCVYLARSRDANIPPNTPAIFELGLVADGTPRAQREVIATFGDGRTAVALAEVPIPEAAADRYISLIGLGGIFLLFLIARAFRRGRQARNVL